MYHTIDATINVGVVARFEAKFETSRFCGAHDGARPLSKIKVYPSENQTWLTGESLINIYKWHVKYRKSRINFETIFSKDDL